MHDGIPIFLLERKQEKHLSITWRNETRKISDLTPAGYNPRFLTEEQSAELSKSLSRFNLADPIVINADNKIIGGHMRINILKQKGIDEVDVRVPDRQLTEQEEKELNLRLNKNIGEWDRVLLANISEDMLKDVGFSSDELDKIFKPLVEPDDDDIPENVNTIAQRGDIWQLGRHRIMCGDSTDHNDVAQLMDGNKAEMIFTDPPYNVNYQGRGKKTSTTIENDNMSEPAFREFLTKAFQRCREILSECGALYCCYASRTHREFEDALNASGIEVRNQIIWVKLVASMGWGNYRWKHEPIFYCNVTGGGGQT